MMMLAAGAAFATAHLQQSERNRHCSACDFDEQLAGDVLALALLPSGAQSLQRYPV
jgi:hypothetical protein